MTKLFSCSLPRWPIRSSHCSSRSWKRRWRMIRRRRRQTKRSWGPSKWRSKSWWRNTGGETEAGHLGVLPQAFTGHTGHKLNGSFLFCRLAQTIREKNSSYDTKLNDFLELRWALSNWWWSLKGKKIPQTRSVTSLGLCFIQQSVGSREDESGGWDQAL